MFVAPEVEDEKPSAPKPAGDGEDIESTASSAKKSSNSTIYLSVSPPDYLLFFSFSSTKCYKVYFRFTMHIYKWKKRSKQKEALPDLQSYG